MEKEVFHLDEKEIDIIHEALTVYRDLVSAGGYAYEESEVDKVIISLGFDD